MFWEIFNLVCYAVFGLNLFFVLLCVFTCIGSSQEPVVYRSEAEKYFYDPRTKKRYRFPSLDDGWSTHLSVIVPAFDEQVRLPPMLDECLAYLQTLPDEFKYEIIVVSDGSRDATVAVAQKYTYEYGPDIVRVLRLVTNRGKGGAVRLGMQSARGAVLLFADADGATKFADLAKLEASLKALTKADYKKQPDEVAQKVAIVCGSRAHLEKQATATRSYFRTILMHGFHFLVWLFAVRGVRDTQCGFKLLTRAAARHCFYSLHVERWAFDVEMLYIAETLRIPVSEVAVHWTEIEGSKIVPVLSWLQMGKDVFFIWFRYRIGAWNVIRRWF